MLHLQRPRRGEDLPRLPGDDDDDATENDDNDDTQFSRSVASLQKQNVFDSFEYPSPLPPGFHTDEEPSPETGWCTVIIVKILYLVAKISAPREEPRADPDYRRPLGHHLAQLGAGRL